MGASYSRDIPMYFSSDDDDSLDGYEDEYGGWSSESDAFYDNGIKKRARLDLLPRKSNVPRPARVEKSKSSFNNPERESIFVQIARDMLLRYSSYSAFTKGELLHESNGVKDPILYGTLLKASVKDDEAIGTLTKVVISFAESGKGIVHQTCTCKESIESPLWCCHVVATLLMCIKEPHIINDYFHAKKILSELSKEELVIIMLNKMVDTPEFMAHVGKEVTQSEKPVETAIVSLEKEKTTSNDTEIKFPFDITTTLAQTKEFVSTTLKEDNPVDDWAITRIISSSFNNEPVWSMSETCPCGFCTGYPMASPNRFKGIIRDLVDIVEKFWQDGEVHNTFRCLAKASKVLSLRAGSRNICVNFKEGCRKVLYLWVNFLAGCPLPVADRLAWTNELTLFSFDSHEELNNLIKDGLYIGRIGWDVKELHEVMAGNMHANYQESPIVIAARLRVLDHQRYFQELQNLGKFAAHKFLGKLENPAELHDMATAVMKAMPYAAFLFEFKRFMLSKKSEGKATDMLASELKDSGKALIDITCENLAVSKQDRANRDDQDTPSLVELGAAKVAHVLIVNNDYENLVDTLESVPLNIQKILMLELGKQMICSISAQLAFECAKIFSAASEHKAALQLALAGLNSPTSQIEDSEYAWIMKLASEMGPNTYRMIAKSVAVRCSDPAMLWEYCLHEIAASQWVSATSFFVNSCKWYFAKYYETKKSNIETFLTKMKATPPETQISVLKQILGDAHKLDYVTLSTIAEAAEEVDRRLALDLAVKALSSNTQLRTADIKREKKRFIKTFADLGISLGSGREVAELYINYFMKDERSVDAYLQAKEYATPYSDLLAKLDQSIHLIEQPDQLMALFIKQRLYKDIGNLFRIREHGLGALLILYFEEIAKLPKEEATKVWEDTYELTAKSGVFYDVHLGFIPNLEQFDTNRVLQWSTTFLQFIAHEGFPASDKNYQRFYFWMDFTKKLHLKFYGNLDTWRQLYDAIIAEPSIRRKGKLVSMITPLK